MHYRIHAGVCEGCGHGGIQHYSHFNKYILNPIQREGYSGDGRRAMFLLKNEVLDKTLLRRTKENRASDMELPPRLVQIKEVRLHPVEEDFYNAREFIVIWHVCRTAYCIRFCQHNYLSST